MSKKEFAPACRTEVVHELVDGMLLMYPHLNVLRPGGEDKSQVILRSDYQEAVKLAGKVALISGGGSGHEPAHAGYVGKGMLTAAVAGDLFASPSYHAVYMAICEVTGPAGCLLIVKNYTGDRLHFTAAKKHYMEKHPGVSVEVVMVADDAALPAAKSARGVAGTLFVHKLAGAAAEQGRSLAEVAAIAQAAADNTRSLGLHLSECDLPSVPPGPTAEELEQLKKKADLAASLEKEVGAAVAVEEPAKEVLKPNEAGVGVGIHGELARKKVDTTGLSVGGLMALLIDDLVCTPETEIKDKTLECSARMVVRPGQEVIVMVNNLGTASQIEMPIATKHVMALLEDKYKLVVKRLMVGTFLTALDMKGITVSIMQTNQLGAGAPPVATVLEYYDAPTEVVAWPGARLPVADVSQRPALLPVNISVKRYQGPDKLTEQGELLKSILAAAATALVQSADVLTKTDLLIGDGDCGDTLAAGGRSILNAIASNTYPLNSASETFEAIAVSMGASMGGTSGAMYHFWTSEMSTFLEGKACTAVDVGAALAGAVEELACFGGAREGSSTMMDALIPASHAFDAAVKGGKSVDEALIAAAVAAKAGKDKTKTLVATHGRANYIAAEAQMGVADPGAMAIDFIVTAIAEKLVSADAQAQLKAALA